MERCAGGALQLVVGVVVVVVVMVVVLVVFGVSADISAFYRPMQFAVSRGSKRSLSRTM